MRALSFLSTSTAIVAVCSVIAFAPQPSIARVPDAAAQSAAFTDALNKQISQSGFWKGQAGAWKTKTQFVLEPKMHRLVRKTYTVWDFQPARNLDFVWNADQPFATDAQKISGSGRLEWRLRERPAYDGTAVVAVYTGNMLDGRPQGYGEYKDEQGLVYAGNWENGLSSGDGRLIYPNGDEYAGNFDAGVPNGPGRFINSEGIVFEGKFVDGLPAGPVRVSLTDGTSYVSDWQGGTETNPPAYRIAATKDVANAANLRMTVRVKPPSVADFKIVDSGMTADEMREELSGSFANGLMGSVLGYAEQNTPQAVIVQPADKRLVGMWKGNASVSLTDDEEADESGWTDYSYGVFSRGRSHRLPVSLSVQIQNSLGTPQQVTGIYLDVADSASDLQPAVQVTRGYRQQCASSRNPGDYNPRLKVENYGWGAMRNAVVRFAFVAPHDGQKPKSMPVSIKVGNVDKSTYVNFEASLIAAGVNAAALKQRNALKPIETKVVASNSDEMADYSAKTAVVTNAALRARIVQSRLFGTLGQQIDILSTGDGDQATIDVAGFVEYDWTDAAGQSHHRQSPFRSALSLGVVPADAECGEGSATDQVSRKPLQFSLDRKAYRVAVPFQRTIPAGRTSNYALMLTAPRSSRHHFVIVAQLASGQELRSRPIDLLYFKPSWDPKEGF